MNTTKIGFSGSRDPTYGDSVILITGGTGSIGLELTKTLLNYKPREIRLFSNDENGLFEARNLLRWHPEMVYRLGDVRDAHSIEAVMKDCDFVFHAAALKHVDFCEGNPYEAISTNILGTQNVIEYAIKYGVRKFVFISTDKSVNPLSTMGATKLLGERLTISASKLTNRPVFSVVRFGNVLGSRGSVALIFERQVRDGDSMTVTDPDMTRFIMLPSEAAMLVLRAAELAEPGEVLVLKMKAVRIGDLAEASREFFARAYHKDAKAIRIVRTGSRQGEKLHEELMTNAEAQNAVETEEFYIVNPHAERLRTSPKLSFAGVKIYTSDSAPLLTREEIASLLSHLYSHKQDIEKQR